MFNKIIPLPVDNCPQVGVYSKFDIFAILNQISILETGQPLPPEKPRTIKFGFQAGPGIEVFSREYHNYGHEDVRGFENKLERLVAETNQEIEYTGPDARWEDIPLNILLVEEMLLLSKCQNFEENEFRIEWLNEYAARQAAAMLTAAGIETELDGVDMVVTRAAVEQMALAAI